MENNEEIWKAIRACAETAGDKSIPTEVRLEAALEAALAVNHLAAALKTLKEVQER